MTDGRHLVSRPSNPHGFNRCLKTGSFVPSRIFHSIHTLTISKLLEQFTIKILLLKQLIFLPVLCSDCIIVHCLLLDQ